MRVSPPIIFALLMTMASLPIRMPAQVQPPIRGYLNDSALALLQPFIGRWKPVVVFNAPGRAPGTPIVAEDYRWVVGTKAIHYRENYPVGFPDSAIVDGLIFWNPASERVEFVGVSGPGPGQGHLYMGEYHLLSNGVLERVFEGFYRTLDDVPGDAFGGLRRRYRQQFTLITPDSASFTLDWFHDGAWRPLGQFAKNPLVRIKEPIR